MCRACGGTQLHQVLQLGPTPLANSFLRTPEDFDSEEVYPLDVYFCETCSLLELLDVIDPEVLFRDYIYVSGTSETVAIHYDEYANTVVQRLNLGPNDLVVEIASNDGSLLKRFRKHGVSTLGVEPAENIAAMAQREGIDTVNCFFHSQSAKEIFKKYGPAKVLVGNNVLAHVDDTQDFLRGCHTLLDRQGTIVIEVPYVHHLVENLEYDTIYHEHLCYFSVNALMRLFEECDLSIVHIDQVPIHGGSLRVFGGHQAVHKGHSEQVLALATQEKALGLTSLTYYQKFAKAVQNSRTSLLTLLQDLSQQGWKLAAYAAPAKGNTLLNYCGIGPHLVPFTVDKNPMKVGRFTPGMHIPVLPVSAILEQKPDYLLILAWNFADEIIRQQNEFRFQGGKFIIPIPKARVV